VSAIAGWIDLGGKTNPRRATENILARLADFGPDLRQCRSLGGACFGRALHRVLPEDDFDTQPLIGGGGRYLLTADVRIDNRDELAARLAVSPVTLKRTSDAGLLLAAWERWQLKCVDYLLGDFAFAVWDVDQRKLTLARGPLATKCLFYHRSTEALAFASMPQALLAMPQVPRRLDFDEAAAIAAGATLLGPATIFKGINRVQHGHAVECSRGRERVVQLWKLDRGGSGRGTVAQLGEALRSELERAATAQLRRRAGIVASQLSSGRDSSAVATTAAMALKATGEPLLALTGAPRAGFSDGGGDGYLCDESGLAARTASVHDNMVHHVCRHDCAPLAPQLDRLHRLHFGPLLNPSNLPWWARVNQDASARGASVLLTGATGNFSISAGGPQYLADLWRRKGLGSWSRHALRLGRVSPSRWRNVISASFGSMLPQPLYSLLLNSNGRGIANRLEMPLLQRPTRHLAEVHLERLLRDRRPPQSAYDFRREMLLWVDNSEKLSLACWGLDVRDPTSDRRLVELCFSFPPELLTSPASARPIYEAAFGDRIPREVLTSRRRGYQTADWFELFRKEEIREAFRTYRQSSAVEELVDFQQVDHLLDAWPSAGWHRSEIIDLYRNKLLGTLALASFISVNFPG
jgi:asparagine synthase (glutamine-hydrolysing)